MAKTPINSVESFRSKTSIKSYKIEDYDWVFDYETFLSDNEKKLYPKILISEFQPVPAVGLEKLKNDLKDIINKGAGLLQGLSQTKDQISGEINNKHIPIVSTDKIREGTKLYRNLLSGDFLNNYEIPYTGKDYISGDGSGWQTSADMLSLGGLIDAIGSLVGAGTGPTMPTWKKPEQFLTHETEFMLRNSTPENTKKNYDFLRAIIPGTMWIQNDRQEISPNLYQLEVPGRFRCYLATMKITITFEGQIRKDEVTNNIIGLPLSVLLPDAFKVKFEFTELIPNNFNMFMAYDETMKDEANSPGNSNFSTAASGHRTSTLALKLKTKTNELKNSNTTVKSGK